MECTSFLYHSLGYEMKYCVGVYWWSIGLLTGRRCQPPAPKAGVPQVQAVNGRVSHSRPICE